MITAAVIGPIPITLCVKTDLNNLLTTPYVHLDDRILPAVGFSRAHHPGRKPVLNAVELLCLIVAQQMLGIASDRKWIRYARSHLLGRFPNLPQQSGWGKHVRQASGLLAAVITELPRDSPSWAENTRLIDSTPLTPLVTKNISGVTLANCILSTVYCLGDSGEAGMMTNQNGSLQQHPSLAVAAQDWITNEILAGRITPGQKLAEVPLAKQMGISRSPVREALRALAAQGLIVVEPRRGACVADIDARQAAELYACRLLIEPECVGQAAVALSEKSLCNLVDAFERMKSAVRESQAEAYVSALETYNRDLLNACPNRLLLSIAESTWRRSLRYWGLLARHSPTYMRDSLRRNTVIHNAVIARDGSAAAAALTDLLEWSRGALDEIIAALPPNKPPEGN